MKLIYRPFGLLIGILAGLVSKKLFEALWGIFDEEEPPKPVTRQAAWPPLMACACRSLRVVELPMSQPPSALTTKITASKM